MSIFELNTLLRDSHLADGLSEESLRMLLDRARAMESRGYDLGIAGGTLELLILEERHPGMRVFDVVDCEVRTRITPSMPTQSTATVTLDVHGHARSATVSGDGPIHAMDLCLRQCLFQLYPAVADARLADYQLRVLEPGRGTAAKARVSLKWTDSHGRTWTTMGVSEDVLEASWQALVDGVRLELLRPGNRHEPILAGQDYSWGV